MVVRINPEERKFVEDFHTLISNAIQGYVVELVAGVARATKCLLETYAFESFLGLCHS